MSSCLRSARSISPTPQNWVALLVLLVVSLVASHLSSSVRARAEDATARRDEVTRLFDLSRDILLTTDSQAAHLQLARSIAAASTWPTSPSACPRAGLADPRGGRRAASRLPLDELETALRAAQGRLEFDARSATYSGPRRSTPARRPRRSRAASPGRTADRPARVAGRTDRAGHARRAGRRRGHRRRARRSSSRSVRRRSWHRQSDELKSALLASLAHDLRTPLTAIRVAASNLQAGWASEEERRAQSDIVLAEVERLNRLFQNILDMARIETDGVTAAREWVTPDEIVEAAADAGRSTRSAAHRLAVIASSRPARSQVDPRAHVRGARAPARERRAVLAAEARRSPCARR